MKIFATLLIVALLLFVSAIGRVQAEINEYKCAKWSSDFFYREFKSDKGSLDGLPAAVARVYCLSGNPCDFRSHFNRKQNKCFILVQVSGVTGKALPSGATPVHIQYLLYDAYERQPYGVYEAKYSGDGDKVTTTCWLKDKFGMTSHSNPPSCAYEYEFLEAIKSYFGK